jgi:thiol-disulfide isomerase/thioredoxin
MKNLTFFIILLIVSISCKTKTKKTHDSPIRTVVTGRIINPNAEEPHISLAVNWVGFPQEEFETKLDSTGSFKFEFSTYVSVDAWVVYQTNFLVLLQPGDSLHVEFDGTHQDRPELLETISFEGTAAEHNRQIANYQKQYYSSSLYLYANNELYAAIKNYEPDKFREFADSVRGEQKIFLDNFITQFKPAEFVQTWATHSIYKDYYSIMSFYPSEHRKANVLKQSEWSVPISYYDHFKEPLTIEVEKGLQSGYAISGYIDNYLSYIWRLTRDELNASNDKSLTESKTQFDSLALNLIIRHTPQGLFRETMITYVFSNFIEYSEIETFEKYKPIAENNIQTAFLREPLFKKYEKAKEKISKAENIEFNGVEILDKFLDGIITNNKGKKIIYVDIWATWCGPCRDEFPYSKILQDEFIDNVDFVFVCIESGENAFKNTIKEFQLKGTHYFLNKEQSRDFSEQLQLNGVPHYILIDQNGKTVSSGFEYRPSEDRTKEKIESLLKG